MLVISYGGGVNSTAMILWLLDTEPENMRDARIVFADTGAEWPETYAYVHVFSEWLERNHRLCVEWVSVGSLEDYCRGLDVIPARVNRFCTRIFKQEAIARWRVEFQDADTVECIGFAADEAHRADSPRLSEEIAGIERPTLRFPLIEGGIDRVGCGQLILKHCLEVPPKSGCWCCSFQRVGDWRRLWRDHPGLFEKAMQMEEAANARRLEKNPDAPMVSFRDKPLRDRAAEWDADHAQSLFDHGDVEEAHPCRCGL